MQFFKGKYGHNFLLALVLIAAVILRFIWLSTNSLWVDELHTMNEAAPYLPLKGMLEYLGTTDQHPPLFFLLERLSFIIIGFNETGARILPAICGVVSVWSMYLLGKELKGVRLGLFAAIITCVNIYNIWYSQEARGYIFLWLFTSLSYLYFIRMYKYSRLKDAIGHAIFSILLIYTHYFSLLVFFCQALMALIFWITGKESCKRFLLQFLISGVIVFLSYLPWLPYFFKLSEIRSFWAGPLGPMFLGDYLYEYFANTIIIAAPLVIYFIYIARGRFSLRNMKNDPLSLSATFFFISIFFSLLIPVLKSILVFPMLVSRYIIIIVPSFILCIAYGLDLIQKEKLRNTILSLIVLMSLADIFFIKKIYASDRKEQFREMSAYISKGNKNYPIINELTGWHQSYYLKRFHYTGKQWFRKKEKMVDSVLKGWYQPDTFWIVGAHGDPHLDPGKRAQLDTTYKLVKEKEFYKAWAEQYARKTPKYYHRPPGKLPRRFKGKDKPDY